MNKLETEICSAVRAAFNRYRDITGWWLDHAPEHFLQNFVFLELADKGREIYAEATAKKISAASERKAMGRPPRDVMKKYDLVVWNKATASLRAVIEIKRAGSLRKAVVKDGRRVRKCLNGTHKAKAGYFLIYTDAKASYGRDKLREKVAYWAEELGLTCVHADFLAEEKDWIAGYALFRAPGSKPV